MDGYVISLVSDTDGTVGYWSGTTITDSLHETVFFDDITPARQAAGTLQNQYTDRDVRVVAAIQGIQLKNAVNNVATSNQSASSSV